MIPQRDLIEVGKLYGGEYAGHREPAVAKIRRLHLVALGIRAFVDLTAPADCRHGGPYADETMETILGHIRESSSQAPAV